MWSHRKNVKLLLRSVSLFSLPRFDSWSIMNLIDSFFKLYRSQFPWSSCTNLLNMCVLAIDNLCVYMTFKKGSPLTIQFIWEKYMYFKFFILLTISSNSFSKWKRNKALKQWQIQHYNPSIMVPKWLLNDYLQMLIDE